MKQDRSLDALAAASGFVGDGVDDAEAALAGARDIIAEQLSDDAGNRQVVRQRFAAAGFVSSKRSGDAVDAEGRYRVYHEFRAPLRAVQPHQWLALQRGQKDGSLRVHVETPDGDIVADLGRRWISAPSSAAGRQLQMALEDGYDRLLRPAIERETAGQLTDYSDRQAIQSFATNLRNLLLQPPVSDRRVMGIDPGFRTGCKVATVDATGRMLTTVTIFPHPPQNERLRSLDQLSALVERDQINVIAIGNGTASRETESLVAELIARQKGLAYVIVSEAGASVYSASDLARSELPDLDVSMRGAVSIARRLQDPLAELVKIDPQSIGVGLYQHDVDQKLLGQALDEVVESVVNHVGVDVNTASAALLGYVSGISRKVASAIVEHRDASGPFVSRADLKKVKGLGPKAYEQSAGFLRVPGARNLLDNTTIHPESYDVARRLLELAGLNLRMRDLPSRVAEFRKSNPVAMLSELLDAGEPTLVDILDALERPGRDPRSDLPAPVLRQDVLAMEDLHEGMVLAGTVRNVVAFGAFVDIGVKHDGLVHVSRMAERYVGDPHQVVGVGDVVKVRVVSVDRERSRIELTMVL